MEIGRVKCIQKDSRYHSDDAAEDHPAATGLVAREILGAEENTTITHVTRYSLHDSSGHSKEC